ncbi:biotin transporter BioY [Paenibacillus hamazuiensis]|uniref:biotin transporter BioY n=1 Tax=Paenibacillus hamazuiensis TaxID=2936508 RepID=UPI00200BEBAA
MSIAKNIRGLVFSALFAALFIVLSFVKITLGFSAVPITLQGLGLMLAGGFLGARYGFYSIFTVVLLTFLGLPLLHGQGGFMLVFGPTGGFIWMFPFAALFIGYFSNKVRSTNKTVSFILLFIIMEIGGLLVYITGVPWLAHVQHISFSKAMASGCIPFLLPDVLKALVAAGIVSALRSSFSLKPSIASKDALQS